MPVSHMQMCMHALVTSACEGPEDPLWVLHACPARTPQVATTEATQIHVVRMTVTYVARHRRVQTGSRQSLARRAIVEHEHA